jgi:antitoxin ParD1/3/4
MLLYPDSPGRVEFLTRLFQGPRRVRALRRSSLNIDNLGGGGTVRIRRTFYERRLSPELEHLIQSRMKSGRYNSVSEVVREGLRRLEQLDETFTIRGEEIRAQIEEGWHSAKRGEFLDEDEVFDRIDAELEAMERSAPK